MSSLGGAPSGLTFHVLGRAAALMVLWLVLAGSDLTDLPAGAVAVFAATLTSLRLFPPDPSRLSPLAVIPTCPAFFVPVRDSVNPTVDPSSDSKHLRRACVRHATCEMASRMIAERICCLMASHEGSRQRPGCLGGP
jgi:hypothetical protein